jgi:hypothetical protein
MMQELDLELTYTGRCQVQRKENRGKLRKQAMQTEVPWLPLMNVQYRATDSSNVTVTQAYCQV